MEVAFRRKEKKRATLANQRSRADAQENTPDMIARNASRSRQQTFVKELAPGKTLTQAAKTAGYSDKNPAQSGYQALAQLRGRVPELLERHGLGEEVLIEKYLLPLLEANETKFFNGGKKQIEVKRSRHSPRRAADRI